MPCSNLVLLISVFTSYAMPLYMQAISIMIPPESRHSSPDDKCRGQTRFFSHPIVLAMLTFYLFFQEPS